MTSPQVVFPFELRPDELVVRLDEMVDAVWNTLQSDFMTLPKGAGFLAYERFAAAYEVLRLTTKGFNNFALDTLWAAFQKDPVVFIVIRTLLGMQPPEWAYLTSEDGTKVSQGQARTLDRLVREPGRRLTDLNLKLIRTMFVTAVRMLSEPIPPMPEAAIHRLDKVDTRQGLISLRHVANLGVPFPLLLYERFLGRPFASHRDAVSDIIGDVMETAVEDILSRAGIVFRKTKRAERIPDFDQAPDFIIPDEWRPQIVIEAKITQDDGTARDKVARILRLRQMSDNRVDAGLEPFQVIACLDGRGFGERRPDMRDIIKATQGKVFTMSTLSRLVDNTDLAGFRIS